MAKTEDKQSKKRWRRWARDILLVFILVLLVQWWQTRNAASGPAPALAGPMLSGEMLDIEMLRGKPVLVHFWATWCPICRTEDGSIHALARDYQVITVATNSGDAQDISTYLQQNELDFPVMLDESGMLGQRWGVSGVPSSFVLDKDGEIRSIAVGYTTKIGLQLRLWLAGRSTR